MNEQSPGPVRPLVVRCGAFGDMVLLTPLIRRLSERFGQPVDLVSSGPWTIPLLQGQPGVGRIHLLESRNTPYWLNFPKQRIARELRRNGPAPAWFCDGNGAAFDVLLKGGVPKDWVLDVRDLAFGAREHFVIRWSRFANMTPPGLSIAPSMPGGGDGASQAAVQAAVIDVLPAWRSDLSTWLETRGLGSTTLHLVQAGNKRTMRSGRRDRATNTKYWPEERWAEVVRHIRQRSPDSSIVLLGTPGESELNDDIIRLSATKNVHNAALDLPIPRLLALMESASSLVTVDSGPAHAAAAVGCPQVVLFGQADPELYRPWGAAGAQAECLTGSVDGQASMLGIGADEVTAAWDALAKRARPSPAMGVAAR
jgi:heptosyltransferase-2/heptosyltransferase-3